MDQDGGTTSGFSLGGGRRAGGMALRLHCPRGRLRLTASGGRRGRRPNEAGGACSCGRTRVRRCDSADRGGWASSCTFQRHARTALQKVSAH